jgi:Lon protease-like protein
LSVIAVFPLGTVVFPTTVLPLQLFEPRYLALIEDLIAPGAGEPDFGIVLIERGSEVGGGDVRGTVGTVVRLVEAVRRPDGTWVIAVAGIRRFQVQRWLPDDPYPRAETSAVDDIGPWDGSCDQLLTDATRAVRRALALAAELGDPGASMGFDLDGDPSVASWQLCALAPLGPMDRQQLLETDEPARRLRRLISMATEMAAVLEYRLGAGS